ncbi:hypothetical protein ACQ3I4_07535 [Zafaria sp. Z1313]|uniref:hypothetical protein n=1 Tax=unclassified Zafaria TaxID=2828765 RepID=UPI002E76AA03|nr:hypothetical protein [Zafaria sp. J156]MEE1620324.1 hypothetical protein [Zafaria sp. J156]
MRATGHGPWPGTDAAEAARIVRGELGSPHLPHLVQLPDRGVGSDATGRTAALLQELYVDVQPFGWRLTDRPGADHRRAASALSSDLDVLADVVGAEGRPGPELQIQFTGPLSLAAGLYLHHGERALSDHGARRDVAASLAAGAAAHVADVLRLAGAPRLTVLVDEPLLADVLRGAVPTASGYRTLRSVPRQEVVQAWTELGGALRAAGASAVVLAPGTAEETVGATYDAVASSGADAVYQPAGRMGRTAWEASAELVESGAGLWLGVVDPARPLPAAAAVAGLVRDPWRRTGLETARLGAVTLLPTGGLDGVTPAAARTVLARLTEAADALDQIVADS